MHRSHATHHHVAIIGSGFGGLGTAIRLKQQGIDDFVVLERADDVGGVWRDNRYPGCACDVESHLYSFSFAPNPNWSRAFSPQQEIWSYLRDCAARYGVMPHIRLGHDVRGAAWDDEAQRCRIETSRGLYTAVVLVAAAGALGEPAIPALPELERFRGAAAVEPRPGAQAAFVAGVDERMRGTVWLAGGCRSWYLDATGRASALWPGSSWSFRRRAARFRPDEYVIMRRHSGLGTELRLRTEE